jgi:hypothetical protein
MAFDRSPEDRRRASAVNRPLTELRAIGEEERSESAIEGQEDAQDEARTALQAARRAPPHPLTQQPAEIEGTGLNQDPLEDVRPASQVGVGPTFMRWGAE